MTKSQNPWMTQTLAFFKKHPEREFSLGIVPVSALRELSASGWIVGAATCPDPSQGFQPLGSPGQSSLTCIVRRADKTEGRPVPLVFFMDGAPASLPKGTDARSEEQFCETFWGLMQVAKATGVSLIDFMLNPALLSMYLKHQHPAARKDLQARNQPKRT